MSMFVFLNSTLQVLLKISLLKEILSNKTDSFICIKYFNLQNKICTYRLLTEIQCFVRTLYINDMDIFGGPIHEFFFFLNNVGDTILFNSVGKMSHIFGPKLDIVAEPYMKVLILLPCSAVLFLRL